MQDYLKKSRTVTLVTLLVYGLLVATHLGEFWPFSIFPMFSRGGHPWERAIVRDVSTTPYEQAWDTTGFDDLPGKPVALDKLNINQNDIANYLSKTEVWNEKKIKGLEKMFAKKTENDDIVLYSARGSISDDDSVTVRFVPYIYISADSTVLNPKLKPEQQ